MTGRLTKFRVGVLTILEVEVTSNWRDAQRVAEGALAYVIGQANVAEPGEQPIIRWQHSNRANYEAKVIRRPIEIDSAARNSYLTLDVHQLTSTEED